MLRGKQAEICRFGSSGYDALICDGAIRSGKTSVMTVAFVEWAMQNFSSCVFGICGKTVGSARRNIVAPFLNLHYTRMRYIITDRRSDNMLVITARRSGHLISNTFYIFGGKDESSQDLIQGITLAGILLDEVALMPESFVNQATARCSVAGSKYWFNCNPESPEHWFKRNWIDKAEDRNALRIHFSLSDNPSLSPAIRARYEAMYTGVFYQRYVLGLWVKAEGLVYHGFDRAKSVVTTQKREYERYIVSMDYGTYNPTAMLLWGCCGGVWYAVREYYHNGREGVQKTDDEYYRELESLCDGVSPERLIIDPSAASFITLCRQRGRFHVLPARNDVLPGIRDTATAIRRGTVLINDCCVNLIREFELYAWDDKKGGDAVIKTNEHAMDALRYFVYTMRLVRMPGEQTYTSPFGG